VRSWSWGVYDNPYAIPDLEATYTAVEAPAPIGPWRAVFSPSSVSACNVFHTETYVAYVAEVSIRKQPLPGALPFVVHRVVGAVDCGVVIHRVGVEQQVESGIVWALSNMKTEVPFEKGRPRPANFDDFTPLTLGEMPEIETHLVDSGVPRPHGLGEPTVCPLAPAVASALSRLAGHRVRRLPVTAGDLA
jgi:CO/xanthine dehydrogenase Mo-binding subunit